MLKPMQNTLIVEIELRQPGGERESGIVLVEAKLQGMPATGTVFAIGDGFSDDPDPVISGLKVGDRVHYHEESPQGFKHEGKKLMKLHKNQLVGIYYEND